MLTVTTLPVYPSDSDAAGPIRVANRASGPAGAVEVTREQIVRAAIELIDRDGLRFTVGKIDQQLAVRSTALSRLFPDREALLDAVADSLIEELFADPQVQPLTSDWHEYLHRIAQGIRRVALAHPHVFPLLATRPTAAPWLQPPLRSLRWMEAFLDTLHQGRFSDRAAVGAYRAFSSFLLGHLLLEVSALGADITSVPQPHTRQPRPSDLADYPRLRSMHDELVTDDPLEEFEEALEALLDRLETKGKR